MRIMNTGNSPIRELSNQSRCCCRGSSEMLLLVLWGLVATATALYGSGDAVVDLTPATFDKQARIYTNKSTVLQQHCILCVVV
jgi:hypothetical protein